MTPLGWWLSGLFLYLVALVGFLLFNYGAHRKEREQRK